jgi:hypothetical protein
VSRTLDLTGSAQVYLSGATATGSITSPGAGAAIAAAAAPAGTYQVYWPVTLAGAAGAGDANNFALFVGAAKVATSSNTGAAGTYAQAATVTVPPGGAVVSVQTIAAGTAGVTYTATIVPGGGGSSAAAGPRVPGEAWNITGAAVSVLPPAGSQTPVNESACSVYNQPVGPFPVNPQNLLGATFTGSSGDSFGPTVTIQPGQHLLAVWSGGDAGQLATLSYWGTRTVP